MSYKADTCVFMAHAEEIVMKKRFLCVTIALLATMAAASPVFAQGLPSTTPENAGMSSERLERLSAKMHEYVDQEKLAGLNVIIARHGKIAYSESFGMRDKEAGKPMEPDTIFRIFSMSKPITSTAVMMLYEEGLFQLNDPVSKFIPEFKDIKVYSTTGSWLVEYAEPGREITVRDLLTHSAGMTYGLFGNTPVDEMYMEANIFQYDTTLEEMVAKLVKIPILFEPGSQFHYSISIAVLGRLVEVVSGMPFDTFMETRMFGPLGMKDTGFIVPPEKRDRFAKSYTLDENGNLKSIEEDTMILFNEQQKLLLGGEGLVSTAHDYIRFTQMILNGGELDGVRLLSPKTIELMSLNHLDGGRITTTPDGSEPSGWGFGLGFAVREDVARSQLIGTKGELTWSGAYNTYFWIDPKEELIGLMMTQFDKWGYYPIFREIKVLANQAIVE